VRHRPAALAARCRPPAHRASHRWTRCSTASDADIVVLATPSGLHPRRRCRPAAGRHVLTEKPMATKWDEGMAMVRGCRDAGVKLFVVKQNRLNPRCSC
jgi:UDP-N-acetyl-2-amino-2-deoxyglucuronate dehydrogenase